MSGNLGAALFALAAGLALQACGSDERSAPADDEDAGSERDTSAASLDDSGAGEDGAEDELDGGAGAAADDAAAPVPKDAGGTRDAAGPQADAQASADLSGTWITKIETLATESLPLVGELDVQLELAIRLFIAQSAGTVTATFEICDLATETIPEADALVVTFPPALIATLRTKATSSVTSIRVGDALPIPKLTIRSGIDMAQKPLDADADSHPGVTVPSNIGGVFPIDVYTGLTVEASIAARLMTDGKITGTADFSVSGSVFGSDNELLTEGMLSVAPKSDAVALTATRLAGDVPCSEVLSELR